MFFSATPPRASGPVARQLLFQHGQALLLWLCFLLHNTHGPLAAVQWGHHVVLSGWCLELRHGGLVWVALGHLVGLD